MKSSIKLIAAIALLASGQAFATTETFSHSTASSAVPFTDNFTLSAFDTTLGTLTGVEIILSTSSTAEVDVFNATGASHAFTNGNSSIAVGVTGPAGATTNQNLVAGPFANTANPGFNAFTGITGSATTAVNVAAANFAAYEAPPASNALSFSVTGNNGIYGGSSVPGVFFSGNAQVGGTVEIIYTYTPTVVTNVPEPATIALLGLGFAGMAFGRRKAV